MGSDLPPPPIFWVKPTTEPVPSFHPSRLPLSPLTNLAPSPLQPAQPSRTQKRNKKRREKLAAREQETGIHIAWQDRRRGKKAELSLSHQIRVDYSLFGFAVSKSDGLTGRPRHLQRGDRVPRAVEYFFRKGFRVIEWDGMCVVCVFFVLSVPRYR